VYNVKLISTPIRVGTWRIWRIGRIGRKRTDYAFKIRMIMKWT